MSTASMYLSASDIDPRPTVCHTGDDNWVIVLTPHTRIGLQIGGTIEELDEAHVRLGEAIVQARKRKQQIDADRLSGVSTAERALSLVNGDNP